MGNDWEFVAGDHLREADLTTVKSLAGLNPKGSQRKKVMSALGLTDSLVREYEREFGNEYEETLVDLDTEEATEEAEDEGAAASAFSDLNWNERCRVYQRICSLKRPLLSPPLVTSKRVIYHELNVVICHVKNKTVYLINDRYRCGRRAQG